MEINKQKFFEEFKKEFGHLTQENVDDLNFLLGKLDTSDKISGSDWEIVKAKYACVLATIYHETAFTFDPISEMGSKRYLMSKPYYPFYGRGFVQLTWKWNYAKFGAFLGMNLVNEPWLANEPETAWLILEEGMTRADCPRSEDPNFTGFTLDDCINREKLDKLGLFEVFRQSRRIINGMDKASAIAGYAMNFYEIIELTEAP